jgi:hypothetical protein
MLGEVDVQRGPCKERRAQRGNELKRVKRRHIRLGPPWQKYASSLAKPNIQVTTSSRRSANSTWPHFYFEVEVVVVIAAAAVTAEIARLCSAGRGRRRRVYRTENHRASLLPSACLLPPNSDDKGNFLLARI